jgi:UDP-N-acetylmuramoylalanine--D-glutamate ligase
MDTVIVLGLGLSGLSACRFLQKKNIPFRALDDKWQEIVTKEEAAFVRPFLVTSAEAKTLPISFIVASPGVPYSHSLLEWAKRQKIEVICDIELALRYMGKHIPPMIGITGTNGKTTTTMLTCAMLQKGGILAKTVGNIGMPLLEEMESQEPLVIELSSFQLAMTRTRALHSGAILNIAPNHLDHHASFEEYRNAKLHIQDLLLDPNNFFTHESVPVSARHWGFNPDCFLYSDGKNIIRNGQKEADLPSKLQGIFTHDTENFLAAFLLARNYGVEVSACLEAFEEFQKPPHRIQFVRTVNGVHFFDDSKGTNVAAVIRAVNAVPSPCVLIAGGIHKGEPYTAWIDAFRGKVQAVVAIGEAAPIIEKDLSRAIDIHREETFEAAVSRAVSLATSGGSVLLSPGCASFDMFRDYKERGKKFQNLVQKL